MNPERFDAVVTGDAVVSHRGVVPADIGIRHGQLARIAPQGALAGCAPAEATFDARGLAVLPGVIDSHVHFREPGGERTEDFESGSRGAVLGGVTCVFDMPNTAPAVLDRGVLERKIALAGRHSWCDFGLYVGSDGDNLEELERMQRMPGVCGVKVFMGSSTSDLVIRSRGALGGILAAGRRLVSLHAEDEDRIEARRSMTQGADVFVHGEWRDVESAVSATRHAIAEARRHNRRIHILHVSTAEEMKLIARNRDLVSCEVLPQHLILADPDCYRELGPLAQQNPPIRGPAHRAALWQAVRDGVVDVIGSDHGPHLLEDKAKPYPNRHSGMPGTQTLLPLLLDFVARGDLTLLQVVDLVCGGPARLFGLACKGRIAVGGDADLTFVDLGRTERISNDRIASKAGWTAYDGRIVTGWPVATMVRGRVVMRDGEVLGRPVGRPARFVETAGRGTHSALEMA
jgi:dihydroorotase